MKRTSALVALCLLAAGCGRFQRQDRQAVQYHRQKTPRYPLVTPLLDVDENIEFRELRPLRAAVNGLVSRRVAPGGGVEAMAVYFRDLNGGPWFGVNEREPFIPASLFKVPIMMVLLKKAEEDAPGLLKLKITPDERYSAEDQEPAPEQQVQSGRTYTIEELIRLMIVHSDNRAHGLLLDYLDHGGFRHLFEDLGLPPPDLRSEAYLSAREYSAFFRILYNASFLSRADSNWALSLLTQTSYKDGLVAGLPPGTVAAHKFGTRRYEGKPDKQLHDCGIVYHPRLPYLLCVMTRGRSMAEQAAAIRDVSALVHKTVDGQAASR